MAPAPSPSPSREGKTEPKPAELKPEPLKYKEWDLKVSGYCDCQGCKMKVENILTKIKGVDTMDVNLTQQKVTVKGYVNLETLIKKLEGNKRHAELWPQEGDQEQKKQGKGKSEEEQNNLKSSGEEAAHSLEEEKETVKIQVPAKSSGDNGNSTTDGNVAKVSDVGTTGKVDARFKEVKAEVKQGVTSSAGSQPTMSDGEGGAELKVVKLNPEPLKYMEWDLKVSGYCDCVGCKMKVENILTKIKGVDTMDVNLTQQKVTVKGYVNLETLIKKLKGNKRHAELWPQEGDQEQKKQGNGKSKEEQNNLKSSGEEAAHSLEEEKETVKIEVPAKSSVENGNSTTGSNVAKVSDVGTTGKVDARFKEVKAEVKQGVTSSAGSQPTMSDGEGGAEPKVVEVNPEPLKYKEWDLKVSGYCDCVGCKMKVENILTKIKGVDTMDVNLTQQKVTVKGYVNLETLIKKLEGNKRHAELWPQKCDQKEKNQRKGKSEEEESNPESRGAEEKETVKIEVPAKSSGENGNGTTGGDVIRVNEGGATAKVTDPKGHPKQKKQEKGKSKEKESNPKSSGEEERETVKIKVPAKSSGENGNMNTGGNVIRVIDGRATVNVVAQFKEGKAGVKEGVISPARSQPPVSESEGGPEKSGCVSGGKEKEKKGVEGNSTNNAVEEGVDELRKPLPDEDACNQFLPSVPPVDQKRDELRKEILQLARSNLEKEPQIMELRNQCMIMRTTELAAAQEKLTELEKQKEDIMKFYSPASSIDRLLEANNKTDEESEALHRQLLDGEIDQRTFVSKYKKLRITYHRRALIHLAAKASSIG